MKFDLYRNGMLFLSTTDINKAFSTFKKWSARGLDVRMKFVRLGEAA